MFLIYIHSSLYYGCVKVYLGYDIWGSVIEAIVCILMVVIDHTNKTFDSDRITNPTGMHVGWGTQLCVFSQKE